MAQVNNQAVVQMFLEGLTVGDIASHYRCRQLVIERSLREAISGLVRLNQSIQQPKETVNV